MWLTKCIHQVQTRKGLCSWETRPALTSTSLPSGWPSRRCQRWGITFRLPKPLIAICFLRCAAGCQGERSAKCFVALEFVVMVSRVSVPSCICSYEDRKAQPCATAAPPTSVQLGQGRVWLQCPSAVPETQTRTSGFPRTCLRLKETRAVCGIRPAISRLVGMAPCCESVCRSDPAGSQGTSALGIWLWNDMPWIVFPHPVAYVK